MRIEPPIPSTDTRSRSRAVPRRRRRLALAPVALVLLTCAGLLTACGSTGSTATAANTDPPRAATGSTPGGTRPADPPYTLRLGFISTNPTLNGPEGFAYEQGELQATLQAAGVEHIELSAFPNGPPLNEAINGGSIDVGIYGDTPAIVGRATGVPTRLVNQSTLDLDAFIVTKKGGASSVRDLEGKTVGVQKGSYIHRYLLGVLDQAGLAGKVTITSLATTDADAALEKGDLDAYAAPIPIAYVLEAKGYPVIDRARKDHPDLVGSSVTAATASFLDAHPGFVDAWTRARTEAIGLVRSDQAGYLDFQAKAQNLPVDRIGGTSKLAEAYPLDGYPTDRLTERGRKLLEETKAFLLDQQLIQQDVSLDEWYVP